MQSYTLDEPSEALLNSTLNDTTPLTPNTISYKPKSESKLSERKSRADNPQRAKSRIPTPKSSKPLLSKCQLDTPSPVSQSQIRQTSTSNQSTPATGGGTSAARHRQLVKLLNNTDKAAGSRALTPTPPGRAMTPTPPDRPKSEAGTGWSRSRSRSRAKGRSCLWKLACDKNCIGNAGFAADGEKWRRKLKFLGDNFNLNLAIDYDKP